MRNFAGAVSIIATGKGADIAGLTATAVCSLTAEPPRLLVCLNMQGQTFDTLRQHGRFCVNVLNQNDRYLAEVFAQMRKGASGNKFDSGDWAFSDDAAPRLATASAAFECRVHSITLLATHGLIIGDIVAVHASAASDPLIYHDGAFSGLAAAPAEAA